MCTSKCKLTCIPICICSYTRTCTHSQTHTYACAHSYAHFHTRTQMYTCTTTIVHTCTHTHFRIATQTALEPFWWQVETAVQALAQFHYLFETQRSQICKQQHPHNTWGGYKPIPSKYSQLYSDSSGCFQAINASSGSFNSLKHQNNHKRVTI